MVDEAGNVLLEPLYDYLHFDHKGGHTLARIGDKFGYLDSGYNTVIAHQFDKAALFEHGCANVLKDGKCFRIDEKGKRTTQL